MSRASTEDATVGTGAPISAASCTVHLPVPLAAAASTIMSTRSWPVSGSFLRKMLAVISMRKDWRSPAFHSENVSARDRER